MSGLTWLDLARKQHEAQLAPNEVPPRYRSLALGAVQTPAFRQVAGEYLSRFWELGAEGRGFALLGRAGTYKTFTAACVANRLREALLDVVWVQCGVEFPALERRRFDERTESRLAWLATAPFCVLDDVSKVRPEGFAFEFLDALVEQRYSNQLPTAYTANWILQGGDWAPIVNSFGAGFARRMREQAEGFTVQAR